MTDATLAALTCPKCESPMRSYERNGIVIDQCTGCRGVFLDRGELERLIEAEDTHYGAAAVGDQPRQELREDRDDRSDRSRDDHTAGGRSGKRRGGFLGDLLDFGD